MATAYDFVAANKRRSVVLIFVFLVVIGGVAWAFTRFSSMGPSGIVLAVIVATGLAIAGYYGGDSLALLLAGAQGPIQKSDNPYLWNMVENLCISTGLAMPKLYLLPESGINAFATGRDPHHASIAVTVGAIEQLANEELEGVLAHELSHVKNYDIRFMTLVAVLVGIIALLSDMAMRFWWFGGRRRSNDRDSGQIGAIIGIISLLLLAVAPIIAQLIKLAVSRKREYLADASAALITRYPAGLANALRKIERDGQPLQHASGSTAHLYFSNPLGLRGGMAGLFSTHPPIADRIAALEKMA